MDRADQEIVCFLCRYPPRNGVLLECYKCRSHGSTRNEACKPFLCGTCPQGHGLSCVNMFLAESVRKKKYPIAKWIERERRLGFLDDQTPDSNWKIADCELCRGDIRGAQLMPVYREYYNSLKSPCLFDDKCEYEGDQHSMEEHLAEVHGAYFEQEDPWEALFLHVQP